MSRPLVQPREHEALAKDCEFVNLRGVHPPLKDADRIKFVEEIQRRESDYKQLGEKYAKFQQMKRHALKSMVCLEGANRFF
jgi:hypothetical protein